MSTSTAPVPLTAAEMWADVGGVYYKAEAAAQNGARIILVPYDQTVVSTTSPLEQTRTTRASKLAIAAASRWL